MTLGGTTSHSIWPPEADRETQARHGPTPVRRVSRLNNVGSSRPCCPGPTTELTATSGVLPGATQRRA
jgi:hypothetical protein